MPGLEFWESLNLWALQIFAAVWIFALGAILGSFLNVVVYRLPRGMPMGMVVSRCPKCANPIAFRDNVPLASWLRLRGRCRSCGQGISPRYPIVETISGGVFLLLFYAELLSGGANLPVREGTPPGLMALLATTPWDLVGMYFYHCALLYLLLGIALMDWDGQPIPRRYWMTAVAIGVAGVAFHPVLFVEPHEEARSLTAKLVTMLAGFAAGCGVGWVFRAIRERSFTLSPWPHAVDWAAMLMGGFLGWQAVCSVASGTVVVWVALFLLSFRWEVLRRVPMTSCLGLVTVVHLLTWRMQDSIPGWLGPSMSSYLTE